MPLNANPSCLSEIFCFPVAIFDDFFPLSKFMLGLIPDFFLYFVTDGFFEVHTDSQSIFKIPVI
jgi:hypothetical protein